jgi:hypothetical protein
LAACLCTKSSFTVSNSMSTRIRSFAQLSPIESTYNQHRRQLLKQGEAKFGRLINVKHEIDENNPKIYVCMSYVRKAWYR